MNDYQISPHLSYRESVYSATAARNGIVNIPNEAQVSNIKVFANTVFEPLRSLIGANINVNPAIHVDIIFRSAELNIKEGGVSNSQHLCLGGDSAADIDNNDFNDRAQNDILFITAYNHLNVDFDQMIAEDIDETGHIGWVHISHDYEKETQRRQSMVSFFVNGERVYRTYDHISGFVRSKYLNEGEN
jgi:hypothetical protein